MKDVNDDDAITDRHEEAVLVAGLAVQLLAVLVEGGGGQPLLALAALQTGAVVRGAVRRDVGLRGERRPGKSTKKVSIIIFIFNRK